MSNTPLNDLRNACKEFIFLIDIDDYLLVQLKVIMKSLHTSKAKHDFLNRIYSI